MKARIDGVNDGDKVRSLQLTARVEDPSLGVKEFDIGRIQLNIIDMDKKATCSSINDPHTTTFDKK